MLQLRNMSAGYGKAAVLDRIDLSIGKGEVVAVLGPNGAGKSTLIKAIMGLVPPSSGWVKIFGKPYGENRRRVGYVPQRESVDWDFPVTVMDVVMMGRYGHVGWFKRPKKADREIARECLGKVKMLPFAKRQISNLSGGQQQRVFLARALAQESDIYFMDEPFAGVDAATETAIIALLHELREKGKTLLVVHHDLPTAISLGAPLHVFCIRKLQRKFGVGCDPVATRTSELIPVCVGTKSRGSQQAQKACDGETVYFHIW